MIEVEKQGKFGKLLMRSNTKLREDRGAQIVKATPPTHGRRIEDLQEILDNLKVDQDNMLDINPSNTQTIINPSDFESESFVDKDIEIGIKIRNIQIKLNVAQGRYNALFLFEKDPNEQEEQLEQA